MVARSLQPTVVSIPQGSGAVPLPYGPRCFGRGRPGVGTYRDIQAHVMGGHWCSYFYNSDVRVPRFVPDGSGALSGHKVSWVTNPSLFIETYEPPACALGTKVDQVMMNLFQHWHYCSAPIDWTDTPQVWLPRDPYKFISPIAFTDAHVAVQDFTRNFRANPTFPMEGTRDWIWYQALSTNTLPQ